MHLFFFHQNFIKRFRYFSQAFRRFRYFFITDKDNYLLPNINKYNKSQSLDFSATFGKHQEEQAKLILNAVKACVLSHHRSPVRVISWYHRHSSLHFVQFRAIDAWICNIFLLFKCSQCSLPTYS